MVWFHFKSRKVKYYLISATARAVDLVSTRKYSKWIVMPGERTEINVVQP
jgi:hypothetical protein